MGKIEDDWDEAEMDEWDVQRQKHDLSPAGIVEQNDYLLGRYRQFRCAADAVTTAFKQHKDVAAVALIGSLAKAPWKEIPRFSQYSRNAIKLWHECKDVDLAVWLTDLKDLNGLRRAKDKALRQLLEETEIGVASHQLDIFVLEPGTDRYLGRLCQFNRCPKEKQECLVPGCGETKFLRQHADFRWRPETLAKDRVVRLFDRSNRQFTRAADLALP